MVLPLGRSCQEAALFIDGEGYAPACCQGGRLIGGEDRFVFWFIYEEQVEIEQEDNQTWADAGRVKDQVKEDDMNAQRGQKNQGQSNPPARQER